MLPIILMLVIVKIIHTISFQYHILNLINSVLYPQVLQLKALHSNLFIYYQPDNVRKL
jgi:hypothetical protein